MLIRNSRSLNAHTIVLEHSKTHRTHTTNPRAWFVLLFVGKAALVEVVTIEMETQQAEQGQVEQEQVEQEEQEQVGAKMADEPKMNGWMHCRDQHVKLEVAQKASAQRCR